MYRGYRDKMVREAEKDKRAKPKKNGPRSEDSVPPSQPAEKGPSSHGITRRGDA
jgi:hypothetical protein